MPRPKNSPAAQAPQKLPPELEWSLPSWLAGVARSLRVLPFRHAHRQLLALDIHRHHLAKGLSLRQRVRRVLAHCRFEEASASARNAFPADEQAPTRPQAAFAAASPAARRCSTKIGCAHCTSFFFLLVMRVRSEGS